METEASGLVKCRTCGTRTLPRIAERDWPDETCELCRDPKLRREVVATAKRARAHFAELDQERAERLRKAG